MNTVRQYILDGHTPVPCEDMATWGKWMETATRHVGDDTFDNVRISTVFLALDHNFDDIGPPVLFETLVFGGKLDGEMERCSTWDEAVAQHAAVCENVIFALSGKDFSQQQLQGETK
jgi:hypothetical protein